MALETPDGALQARLLPPVAFNRETPVFGRLIAGPVRDFNVIFDSAKIAATTQVIDGSTGENEWSLPEDSAILCLTGDLSIDGVRVHRGSVAMTGKSECDAVLSAGGGALLVSLRRLAP